MRIASSTRSLLLALCLGSMSYAQDSPAARPSAARQSAAKERSAEALDLEAPAKAKSADAASPVTTEVYKNIIVPGGKTATLESAMDFSSASKVAVTVYCSACVTDETSLASSGLVIQARWIVPEADVYVAAESKSALAFAYWDAGAAVFDVYGPQFRLSLQNKGTSPLTIKQVTIFRRSQ